MGRDDDEPRRVGFSAQRLAGSFPTVGAEIEIGLVNVAKVGSVRWQSAGAWGLVMSDPDGSEHVLVNPVDS